MVNQTSCCKTPVLSFDVRGGDGLELFAVLFRVLTQSATRSQRSYLLRATCLVVAWAGRVLTQANNSFNYFSFLCWTGFTGEHCEHNIDDCPGHSCQNGGVCVDGVNTYNCQCPPHYTGDSLQPKSKRLQRFLLDLCSHWLRSQVSTALRTWTSVSWCQTHVRTEEPATIRTAVTTACVSTGGRATTAARTSTTVPAQLVTTALPVTIAWLLSSASVPTGGQVHPTRDRCSIIVI